MTSDRKLPRRKSGKENPVDVVLPSVDGAIVSQDMPTFPLPKTPPKAMSKAAELRQLDEEYFAICHMNWPHSGE